MTLTGTASGSGRGHIGAGAWLPRQIECILGRLGNQPRIIVMNLTCVGRSEIMAAGGWEKGSGVRNEWVRGGSGLGGGGGGPHVPCRF